MSRGWSSPAGGSEASLWQAVLHLWRCTARQAKLPACAGPPGGAGQTSKAHVSGRGLQRSPAPHVLKPLLCMCRRIRGGRCRRTPLPAGVSTPAGSTSSRAPGAPADGVGSPTLLCQGVWAGNTRIQTQMAVGTSRAGALAECHPQLQVRGVHVRIQRSRAAGAAMLTAPAGYPSCHPPSVPGGRVRLPLVMRMDLVAGPPRSLSPACAAQVQRQRGPCPTGPRRWRAPSGAPCSPIREQGRLAKPLSAPAPFLSGPCMPEPSVPSAGTIAARPCPTGPRRWRAPRRSPRAGGRACTTEHSCWRARPTWATLTWSPSCTSPSPAASAPWPMHKEPVHSVSESVSWGGRLHDRALVLARISNLGDADLVPVVHLPLAGCQCALAHAQESWSTRLRERELGWAPVRQSARAGTHIQPGRR